MTYEIRLRAYEPGTDTPLGLLPETLSWDASVVHNNDGALTLKVSRLADGGELLGRSLNDGLDVALEVNTTGAPDGWIEPDGCRFLMVDRSYDRTDSARVYDLTLPSWSWLLNKICDLNTGALQGSKSKYAGQRLFPATSDAGDVIKKGLDEHDARSGPAVPIVRSSWTTTTDSLGHAWAKKLGKNAEGRAFPAGQPLHARLDALTTNGLCDWRTRGRGLRIYNPNTAFTDRSATVHLRFGDDLADAPSKSSQADRVARLLVKGDGKHKVTSTDPTIPEHYGRWEALLDAAGVKDDDDLEDAGKAELASRNRIKGEYTRTLTMAGPYLPFRDYQVGDWVTAPGADGDEVLRIMQITVSRDSDGRLGGNLVLGDRFTAKDLATAARVSAITGGSSGVSGNGTAAQPDGPDPRQPSAPTGLTLGQSLYVDVWGRHKAQLLASWSAVATATDGTALDIATYEVWGQPQTVPESTWRRLTAVAAPEAVVESFEPGAEWLISVRALGVTTIDPGAMSAPSTLTFGADETAPNAPSTPTVYPYLGTLVVGWDGLDHVGAAMPADFALCRVEVSADAGSTWSVKDRFIGAGTVSLSGLAYAVEHRVRLVALDLSGNASTPSGVATGTPESAGATLTGELDAGERVRVGPAAGNHVELKYDGMYAYALTPGGLIPVIKLGTGDVDVFALTDADGIKRASISGLGGATFKAVSADTMELAGEDLMEIMAQQAQGLIRRASKSVNLNSVGATETAYLEARWLLPKGRQLRFELPPFYSAASVGDLISHYSVRVAYDGTPVSTSSPEFVTTRTVHRLATYNHKSSPAVLEFDTASQTQDVREARFLLTAKRVTGSGTFNVVGMDVSPVQMLLYDMGVPVDNSGIDNTTMTYISTWDLSAAYLNGAGQDRLPDDYLQVGYNQVTDVSRYVELLFAGNAVSGETSKTVAAATTGATISKAELVFTMSEGDTPSGSNAGCLTIRGHSYTAANAAVPAGTSVVTGFQDTPYRRWYNISSIWSAESRGVHLGESSSDSPHNSLATVAFNEGVQLRLTYQR